MANSKKEKRVPNKFDWNDTINATAASALAGLSAPWVVAPFNAVDSSANAKIFDHMPKGTPISKYYKEMAQNPRILKATYKAVPAKLAKNVPAQIATLGSFSAFKNVMEYLNPRTPDKPMPKTASIPLDETEFKRVNRNRPMAEVIPELERMIMNSPSVTGVHKQTWGGRRELSPFQKEAMEKEAIFGALKSGYKTIKSLNNMANNVKEITGIGKLEQMKNVARVSRWAKNTFHGKNVVRSNKLKKVKDFGKGLTSWNTKGGKFFDDFKKPGYLAGMGTAIGGHMGFASGGTKKTLFKDVFKK